MQLESLRGLASGRSVRVANPMQARVSRWAAAGNDGPDPLLPLAEAVIVADHDLSIQTANQAAADLLGWESPVALVGDLVGTTWQIFDPPRRRDIQVGLVMRGRWQGTTFLARHDGTLVETYLTACRLQTSNGVPAGVVLTLRPPVRVAGDDDIPTDGESFGVDGLPGSFCLFYQPEVDLADGSVHAAEALLRWWHPGLGIVSPGMALANPEWAERLSALQAWTIFAVCRQIGAWEQAGTQMQVAINLSPYQLADAELPSRVHRALALTGIRPGSLAVDLPVESLLVAPDTAHRVASELAGLGVALIIDGVAPGTPLDAFDGLPIAELKVDPAPAAEDGAAEHAIHEIIVRAHGIGALAVAKSVETQEELELVRSYGFDRAFGHVFAAALAPTALAALLELPDAAPSGLEGFTF